MKQTTFHSKYDGCDGCVTRFMTKEHHHPNNDEYL